MAKVDEELVPVHFVGGVPVAPGRWLRSLLVLRLLASHRALTVAELVAGVEGAGFTFAGRPGKVVSDALRAEVARHRVVRAGRGRYRAGVVATSTQYLMRGRVAALHREVARRRGLAA
jgi:hypothetical protein